MGGGYRIHTAKAQPGGVVLVVVKVSVTVVAQCRAGGTTVWICGKFEPGPGALNTSRISSDGSSSTRNLRPWGKGVCFCSGNAYQKVFGSRCSR